MSPFLANITIDNDMGFFLMGGVVVASLMIYRIVDFMLNKYGGKDRAKDKDADHDKLMAAADALLAVDLKKMELQGQTMFDLHNVKDREGVPIWYVRSSLEDAIKKLVVSIDNQTNLVSSLVREVHDHLNRTDELRRMTDTRRFSQDELPPKR